VVVLFRTSIQGHKLSYWSRCKSQQTLLKAFLYVVSQVICGWGAAHIWRSLTRRNDASAGTREACVPQPYRTSTRSCYYSSTSTLYLYNHNQPLQCQTSPPTKISPKHHAPSVLRSPLRALLLIATAPATLVLPLWPHLRTLPTNNVITLAETLHPSKTALNAWLGMRPVVLVARGKMWICLRRG
jgi:hypothetical protein